MNIRRHLLLVVNVLVLVLVTSPAGGY